MSDDVRSRLWNDEIDADSYADAGGKYQAAVMEQYKIYVEMADRVSGRRSVANTFFLTLNTSVFTALGLLWSIESPGASWQVVFPLPALIGGCAAWFYLVRSYRQLNTAKYEVVGAMEERLPASPYWRAEWKALGEGKDRSKYWPLTHLEQWIPVLFAILYAAGFLTVIVQRG